MVEDLQKVVAVLELLLRVFSSQHFPNVSSGGPSAQIPHPQPNPFLP